MDPVQVPPTIPPAGVLPAENDPKAKNHTDRHARPERRLLSDVRVTTADRKRKVNQRRDPGEDTRGRLYRPRAGQLMTPPRALDKVTSRARPKTLTKALLERRQDRAPDVLLSKRWFLFRSTKRPIVPKKCPMGEDQWGG